MFAASKVLLKTSVRPIGLRYSTKIKDDAYNRWLFKVSGYNKYGLLYNDMHNENCPIIKEAVRRLPFDQQCMLAYRSIRANQCLIKHDLLPKEEWTKFEDDHFYLDPYIKEVEEEIRERQEWDAHY